MNRKLYVISAVLVVFGAIAVIGMKTAPRFYGSELSLPEELASVTEIDVDNSMAIVRRNGVWSSRDDDFYPVDNEKVDTLLEWLRQASLTPSPCEEVPSGAAGVTLKTPAEIRLFYPDGENAAERLTVVFGGQCALTFPPSRTGGLCSLCFRFRMMILRKFTARNPEIFLFPASFFIRLHMTAILQTGTREKLPSSRPAALCLK